MFYKDVYSEYMSPHKTFTQLWDSLSPGLGAKFADLKDPEIFRYNEIKLKELGFTPKQIEIYQAVNDLSSIKLRVKADNEVTKITSSLDAYKVMCGRLMDLLHEEFWILCLNRNNRVVGSCRIAIGGVAGVVADVKIIFTRALENNANSIIAFHNHPSGNLKPSTADDDLTKKLVAAGNMLELSVLDHIIIAERGYYSYADEGKI